MPTHAPPPRKTDHSRPKRPQLRAPNDSGKWWMWMVDGGCGCGRERGCGRGCWMAEWGDLGAHWQIFAHFESAAAVCTFAQIPTQQQRREKMQKPRKIIKAK